MRKLKKQIKKEAEQVSEALISLLANVRLPKFRRNITPFFLKTAFIAILLFVNVSGTTSIQEDGSGANAMSTHLNPEALYVTSVKDRFEEKLVSEVDGYIRSYAPDSELDAAVLVSKCLEYETDIIFVLSQALLESHFGTKGKAAETNSVWNVGTYDNGRILYRYKNPNESIEPYLKLVNEKYLIEITSRGDTIYKDLHHLVEDRGYTNYNGLRFASARGYENAMRKLMVRMDLETSISFYQDLLMLSNGEILAYFKPPEDLEIDYSQFQAMN